MDRAALYEEDVHASSRHRAAVLRRMAANPMALPDDRAARRWTKEANASLDTAARRWRPSMRKAVDLEGLWSGARRRAARELDIDGFAVPPSPEGCPFGSDELVDGGAPPRELAARLATTPSSSFA